MELSWQGLHISAKYYPKLLIKCATIICSHSPARTESDPHRDNSNLSSGQASDQDLLSVIRLSCVPTVPFFHCWCYWSPRPWPFIGHNELATGGRGTSLSGHNFTDNCLEISHLTPSNLWPGAREIIWEHSALAGHQSDEIRAWRWEREELGIIINVPTSRKGP